MLPPVDRFQLHFPGELPLFVDLVGDRSYLEREVPLPARIRRSRWQTERTDVRLPDSAVPDVATARDFAVRLGLEARVELYVWADAAINAWADADHEGVIRLGLSSGALEGLDEAERRYVIGHELGHVACKHHWIDPTVAARSQDPALVAKLLAWKRLAELTADRAGLVCAGSLDVALRALFKIATGLQSPAYVALATAVLQQYDRITFDAGDAPHSSATHPGSPMRARGLSLFACSPYFTELTGHPPHDPALAADLQAELAGLALFVNPHEALARFLDLAAAVRPAAPGPAPSADEPAPSAPSQETPAPKAEPTELELELVAVWGFAVIAADEEGVQLETTALRKLVGKPRLARVLVTAKETLERARAELLGRARGLTAAQRRGLVEALVVVAHADKQIGEAERAVLHAAARGLGLPGGEVEELLAQLTRPLD